MKKKVNFLAFMLSLTMLATWLTACSQKPNALNSSQTVVDISGSEPEQLGESHRGGQLIASGGPTDFWPISNSAATTVTVLMPVYETLGRYNLDGTVYGWLAEEDGLKVDIETNTLTIKLRSGIKFHDGSILNAEALK